MNWSNTAVVLALCAAVTSCDKTPAGPSTQPPDVGLPTVVRIEIDGPPTVPPGQSAQFTATAFFTDGSSRDVSGQAIWPNETPALFSISNTGVLTAHQIGDVFIRATFNGKTSGQREVLLLPAGTYKVGGYVEDGEVPVPDARVEIIAGPAAGLFAVTYRFPSGGSYTLLGVSGETHFRVTREGYQPLTRVVRVTDHQQINFDLTPIVPRAALAGQYTLTISTASRCRAALPETVTTQTYTAVLTQAAARLGATLGGGNFVSDDLGTSNRFDGAVVPGGAWFRLPGEDFYVDDPLGDSGPSLSLPDVLVQVTPATFLLIAGTAVATTSATGLSGTLNGTIEVIEYLGSGRPRNGIPQTAREWRRVAACRAPDHTFALAR